LTRLQFSLVLAVLLAAAGTGVVSAAGPQALCFPPDALASNPEERAPRKLDGRPDTKPISRTLAAFSPEPESLIGSIRRVRVRDGRKLIALTFDLCEERGVVTGYDGAIIDT
jgi:hypothetical protein